MNQTGVRILSVKLEEQTAAKEMFVRNWTTSFNDFHDNRQLQDMLIEQTAHGTNLSMQALAPLANSLLVPDARVGRLANIGGDYGDQRFSVQIIVELTNSQMASTYEVITGYTSHLGISNTGFGDSLADDMLFFVNGVADLSRENYGNQESWNIANITQVLSPVTGARMGETLVDTNLIAARPTDAIGVMASNAMSGSGSRTSISSMMMNTENKRSARDNNVAACYLSRTMTSFRDEMLDHSGSSEDAVLNAAASDKVREAANNASTFLRELRYKTSYSQERAVTWGELRKLDNTLRPDDQRIQVLRKKPGLLGDLTSEMFGSENWNSVYPETLIAQQAAAAIPAFMTNRCIGDIVVVAHNATLDNSVQVDILSINAIRQGIDLSGANLQMIKDAFARVVYSHLNPRANMGQTLYIKAHVSLVGRAHFDIELNGGGIRPYTTTIYNDASWSHCLADGFQSLKNLANDLDVICATATNKALGAQHDMEALIAGIPNGARGESTLDRPGKILQPLGGNNNGLMGGAGQQGGLQPLNIGGVNTNLGF